MGVGRGAEEVGNGVVGAPVGALLGAAEMGALVGAAVGVLVHALQCAGHVTFRDPSHPSSSTASRQLGGSGSWPGHEGVGNTVGAAVGMCVGEPVGERVGTAVGDGNVGARDGIGVGRRHAASVPDGGRDRIAECK